MAFLKARPESLSVLALLCGLLLAGCGGSDEDPVSAKAEGDSGPFRSFEIEVEVKPRKAGTPEKPQGMRLGLALKLGSPKGVEPPTLQSAEVGFPPGSRFGGADRPVCSERTLEQGGPEACPPLSLMGRGSAATYADTVKSTARITVVNGGPDTVYLWTELDRPVRSEAAIVGTIEENGSDEGLRLKLKVPDKLQLVAGIPIGMRELEIDAGRGNWLATTQCPDGKWRFAGSAEFEDGGAVSSETELECD